MHLAEEFSGLALGWAGDDDERFLDGEGEVQRFDAADGGLAPLARAVENHAMRGALEDSLLVVVGSEGEAVAREVAGVEGLAEALVEVHVTTVPGLFEVDEREAEGFAGFGEWGQCLDKEFGEALEEVGFADFRALFCVRSLLVRVHGMCIGWSIELFPI